MPKETALEKFFKTHRSTCAVHIYSGDRHCSCGRDEALKEIEALRKNQATQLRMHLTDDGLPASDSESQPAVIGR